MNRDIHHTFRHRHGGGGETITTKWKELECAKGVLGPRKEGGGAVDLLERLNRGRGGAGETAEFAGGEGEGDNIDVLGRLFGLNIDNNDTSRCNR